MTWIKTAAYFKSQFESTIEYNLSLHLQYAVVIAEGLGRSLNIQSALKKPLEMLCEFDHCKIFPSVSGILTTNLTP